jgi:hypothetical protein
MINWEDGTIEEGTSINPSKLPSDELLKALGRVVVSFGRLEDLVSGLVGQLMEVEVEVRHMVTGGMQFSQKSELLKALCQHIGLAEEKRLKKVFALVKKADEERNRVLHSTWFFSENVGLMA